MSRSVATGRSVAGARVAARDMKASLKLSGSGGVAATTIAGLNTGCTFSAWVKTQDTSNTSAKSIVENSLSTNQRIVLCAIGAVITAGFYNGTAYTFKNSLSIAPNVWIHCIFTWSGTVATLTVNGVDQSLTTIQPQSSLGGALGIGRRGDSASSVWNGQLSEVGIWNRVLTDTERSNLYVSGTFPSSGLVGKYILDEGAGSIAYDTSSSVNNGTITNGSFLSDTPTKLRKLVNVNLVYNGDFSYAPPFTAAANVPLRWIDGTASGSVTNKLFGWALQTGGANQTAKYETSSGISSILLDGTAASGLDVEVFSDLSPFNTLSVRCLPNTSYTLTYYLQTNVTSGSSKGAFATLSERSITGGLNTQTEGTAINTTTGRTAYTITLTTQSTTRFLLIKLGLIQSLSPFTLAMTARFSDVQLRPTTPVTRAVVS